MALEIIIWVDTFMSNFPMFLRVAQGMGRDLVDMSYTG